MPFPQRIDFRFQIATFECKQPIGEGMLLLGFELPGRPEDEFVHGGYSSGYDKIKFLLQVFRPHVKGFYIVQFQGLGNFFYGSDLFARAIDEGKPGFRKQDRQRNARKPSAGAQVEDLRPWAELNQPGDAHRMQNMVLIKKGNVLSGDEVDLVVPIEVLDTKLFKPGNLKIG